MPLFKTPQYSKKLNPITNTFEPCYIFISQLSETDEMPQIIIEEEKDITLQLLNECIIDNIEWWRNYVNIFINSSSKHFTKTYTFEILNKNMKHVLNSSEFTVEYPVVVTFIPIDIQIFKGVILVNWKYNFEKVNIDIPVFEEEEKKQEITEEISQRDNLPVVEITEELKELDIDELPINEDSTVQNIQIMNPTKYYEKQKVKEARLKAKLASFKAERQLAKYYEKYGNDISESDSDSEFYSEASESE
jgi:hypothetical protein